MSDCKSNLASPAHSPAPDSSGSAAKAEEPDGWQKGRNAAGSLHGGLHRMTQAKPRE